MVQFNDINLQNAFNEAYEDIFIKKCYIFGEVQIHPNDIVIDCGANFGLFSLFAFQQQAQQIIAYEPGRQVWPYLNQLLSSYQNINIQPFAVSNLMSQQTFIECYFPSASHLDFIDKEINKTSFHKDSYLVPTITLDYYHKKADFIKIDVEGAALEVLQGAYSLLINNKPKLAIACYHYPEEENILKTFLYSLNIQYNIIIHNGVLFAW